MAENKNSALWYITIPGMLTTVQDSGRKGYQQYGMPVAGAMDAESYRLGQRLVGNVEMLGALECTVMGPSFRCEGTTVIAFTGADMEPKINGVAVPLNQAILVKDGDEVTTGLALTGVRMYIAVRGGIQVPTVNGSVATHCKSRIGGLEGRKLQKDDRLTVGSAETLENCFGVGESYISPVRRAGEGPIRVILGPQHARFTEEGRKTFFTAPYVITPTSDRMGYRLAGEALIHTSGADIISDGAVFGSIQVPSDGQPIILMADRQTTGGYTKIGTVITPDLPRLAQLPVESVIHFKEVSIEEAQQLYKEYKEAEETWLKVKTESGQSVAETLDGVASKQAVTRTEGFVNQGKIRHMEVVVNGQSYKVTVEERQ